MTVEWVRLQLDLQAFDDARFVRATVEQAERVCPTGVVRVEN